jgi:tight adherence protein B
MTSLAVAACAALGAALLLGVQPVPAVAVRRAAGSARAHARRLLDEAGLGDVAAWQFVGASVLVGALGAAGAAAVFGTGLPALLAGLLASCAPALAWRRRRARRLRQARDAWPALIEELRVLTGAAGRAIPQALLDVGLRGPEVLHPAFLAARREWRLTTDFERTTRVLKDQLRDPTADVVCETLLLAAEVGGDLDRTLAELAADRRADLRDRDEAEARQSGARLARGFVVLVPAGMALAGLNVGDGRAAYGTARGQLLVAVGIAVIAACWVWAGSIMSLPTRRRVLDR